MQGAYVINAICDTISYIFMAKMFMHFQHPLFQKKTRSVGETERQFQKQLTGPVKCVKN